MKHQTLKKASSQSARSPRPDQAGQGGGIDRNPSRAQNREPEHRDADSNETQGQRFIKNSRYFTICIYGAVMAIVTAVIFKVILDFPATGKWFSTVTAILGPFLFGALLAYVLNPMVRAFHRLFSRIEEKLPFQFPGTFLTVFSIFITYLIVFGFIITVLLYVLPELVNNIIDFVNYIPQAYNSLLDLLNYLQERFPSVNMEIITKPLTDTVPDLISAIRSMVANIVPAIYTVSISITSLVIDLLITVIVSVYMLYDKQRLMYSCWRVIYAFLPKKHIPVIREILSECNRLFSSFVVGKFIDSTIIGVLCFALMTILQLKYSLLISLIVGVTNMIPYFGPFIGAIPGALVLLFINPLDALIFCIMILCLQQFDGLILGPKILGNSTGIKPLWIIFAITIGGSVAGLIGMFLGVPVVAILNYLIDRYLQYRLDKKQISNECVLEALGKQDND